MPRHSPENSEDEIDRLTAIAKKYLRNEPALSALHAFGPAVRRGIGDGPALFIGDQSEIPLYPPAKAHVFEYRMGLLAASGDLLMFARRNAAFENYLSELFGLDELAVIVPGAATDWPACRSLTERCEQDVQAIAQLAGAAADRGDLTIVPYLATGHQWRLAAAIASAASVPVYVCAAPPRLSRRVNDKLWFTALARQVHGPEATPPTFAVYGPAAAAARARSIARGCGQAIIKVPSSAGSIGNLRLEWSQLAAMTLDETRQLIMSFFEEKGWLGRYPLLVGTWESPVATSPSVQTWIPLAGSGPPVVDGIFEQRMRGPEGKFIGAAPAELSSEWCDRLSREAMQLAIVLQHLGYFGRASFDAVLAGANVDSAELHWIECNGRWGGVSLPLAAANRLSGGNHGGLVIYQSSSRPALARPMSDLLELVGSDLYSPETGEGVVLLSPTVFEQGLGAHFMTLAQTQDGAEDLANRTLEKLF